MTGVQTCALPISVYVTQNTTLNRNLCDTILGHKNPFEYHMTIGEATRIAKNRSGNDINKLSYILLGDPAIRLNYPTDYQVKTTSTLDTLYALSIQTIKGYIQTPDYDTAHWFNGKLDITIFDKVQEIVTRDNDEIAEENPQYLVGKINVSICSLRQHAASPIFVTPSGTL